MIKHIVMWNLKGDTPEDKANVARSLKAAFEGLVGKVPGLLHMEVGVDVSGADYACDVVLYSEFDSHESLAAYAHHADHLRVRQELGDVRIARHQVDYHATPVAVRAVA
ncbi:Dabb family protein [Paraburkholderia sp. BCC1885]|uniref:Dabb family protein n=1 Tax=Paraburkholderia sp. BCC1885 TaxID=2562669 RepID=UPI001181E404|nr:Dabb family protein [Paraburkholderia sp. BCC1885]